MVPEVFIEAITIRFFTLSPPILPGSNSFMGKHYLLGTEKRRHESTPQTTVRASMPPPELK
jgi:hypothetical protein